MRRVLPWASLGLVVLGASPQATPQPTPADLVFRNGAVYTVDAARSWARAVAVSGGKIVFVGSADLPRFRRLGIVANFQPYWANGDEYLTELTEPRLGPDRSRWLYPIRSLLDNGAVVAYGSDWSVSSMNPLDGIQVAVTHREPSQGPAAAWLPQEQIALPDAIEGYTIRGAYLDFTEKETGSIEPGKSADLIVLDHNLFEIPASQIHQAKVLWTLLEGKEVYRAPGFAVPSQ